jgi:hypothetical protein
MIHCVFLGGMTIHNRSIKSSLPMSKIKPVRVSNGDEILIMAKTNKPDCTLTMDTSELDTTNQSLMSFKGESNDHFTNFKKNFRIGTENTASNEEKEIRLITTDPAGNVSEIIWMESEPQNRSSNRKEYRQKHQNKFLKYRGRTGLNYFIEKLICQ